MLILFIRYFYILLCSIIILHKIIPAFHHKNFLRVVPITYSLVASTLVMLVHNHNATARVLLVFLLLLIYVIVIINTQITISYAASVIAFCLSYVLLTFSCVIHTFILTLVYKSEFLVPYDKFDMTIGILQLLLAVFLLHSKRLRNGLNILIKSNSTTIGVIFSTCYVVYIIYISATQTNDLSARTYLFLLTFAPALLLLYYWQHRISQAYRERLYLTTEKSLKDEITNLESELKSLQTDNQHLTQIVHKDNKLVPAMETTVLEFLQSAKVLSTEELFTRGNELGRTLQEMAKERKGILTSLSPTNNSMPSSGLIAIDGLLSYMEKRAAESNINYKVKMDDNIKELILTALSEDDLRHLLGDLIENAIIATNYSELPKHISIHLGSLQDKFLLEISDSGIPFNSETYQHFGYEHCSTHQEDGGTGTGFLDIWSIKKKYKASLYIYEYETSSSNIYTKKISFLFDGKNHFLLKTYRDKEIKNSLIRGDLHVFPNEVE